jgi:Lon protease-like protein
LVLFGEVRARIVAQRFEKPYREAVVEPFPEEAGGDSSALEFARSELMARYEQLLDHMGSVGSQDRIDTADITLETLVNAVPSLLNLPAGERQRLLEIDSLLERCVATSSHLDEVLARRHPPEIT